MNNNEQIHEYITNIKNALLSLYDELDTWGDCFENLLGLVNIKVNLNSIRQGITYTKNKINDVYNYILEVEEFIDEAIARSLLVRLMDIDDALDALIKQTNAVKEAGVNVSEGFIPSGINLKLPKSWKETRSMVGR